MPDRCPYVSPIDGAQCIFFASSHTMHVCLEPGEEWSGKLVRSVEDDPAWDPEGLHAWGRMRAASEEA